MPAAGREAVALGTRLGQAVLRNRNFCFVNSSVVQHARTLSADSHGTRPSQSAPPTYDKRLQRRLLSTDALDLSVEDGGRIELSAQEKKEKIASAWNSSAQPYVTNYQEAAVDGYSGMAVGYKLAARFVAAVASKRCEAPIVAGKEMCMARATHGVSGDGATSCNNHKTSDMVQLKESETAVVLDIASAGGEPALTIARAIPEARVIATDLAPFMVGLARTRATEAGVANLEAQVADGEDLTGFEDGSVDAVTCTWGLMLMPEWHRAIHEFARVLRSDGVAIIALWERDPVSIYQRMSDVMDILSPGFKGLIDAQALGDDGGEAVKSAMSEAGLVDVSVSRFNVPAMMPAGSGLKEVWEHFALSTPLEQSLRSMEAQGIDNARQQAFSIFEREMKTAISEQRGPLEFAMPVEVPPGGSTSTAPAFYTKALLVVGRKKA